MKFVSYAGYSAAGHAIRVMIDSLRSSLPGSIVVPHELSSLSHMCFSELYHIARLEFVNLINFGKTPSVSVYHLPATLCD